MNYENIILSFDLLFGDGGSPQLQLRNMLPVLIILNWQQADSLGFPPKLSFRLCHNKSHPEYVFLCAMGDKGFT